MTYFSNKKLFSHIFTFLFSVAKAISHHCFSKRSHYIAEKKIDSNAKSNQMFSFLKLHTVAYKQKK